MYKKDTEAVSEHFYCISVHFQDIHDFPYNLLMFTALATAPQLKHFTIDKQANIKLALTKGWRSKRQPTSSLRRSTHPNPKFHVVPLRRRRPKPVLIGTSILSHKYKIYSQIYMKKENAFNFAIEIMQSSRMKNTASVLIRSVNFGLGF